MTGKDFIKIFKIVYTYGKIKNRKNSGYRGEIMYEKES